MAHRRIYPQLMEQKYPHNSPNEHFEHYYHDPEPCNYQEKGYHYDEELYHPRKIHSPTLKRPAPPSNHVLTFDWNHEPYMPSPVMLSPSSSQRDHFFESQMVDMSTHSPKVGNSNHMDSLEISSNSYNPRIPKPLPKWIQEGLEKMEKEKWKTEAAKTSYLQNNAIVTLSPEDQIKMRKVREIATNILLDVTTSSVRLIGDETFNDILAQDSNVITKQKSESLNALKNLLSSEDSRSSDVDADH